VNIEHWWNDIDRGKLNDLEVYLPQCHLVHHRSYWTALGVNQGLQGEKMATNGLCFRMTTKANFIMQGHKLLDHLSLLKDFYKPFPWSRDFDKLVVILLIRKFLRFY
jgi:hypothetical protein